MRTKAFLKYILSFLVIFLSPLFVYAGDSETIENDTVLCTYSNALNNTNGNHTIEIHKGVVKSSEGIYYKWEIITIESSGKKVIKDWDDFTTVFSKSGSPNVYIDPNISDNLQNKFQCPSKGYLDTDYWNEICFDSDGTYCTSIGGTGTHFANDSKSNASNSEKDYDAVEEVVDKSSEDATNIAKDTTYDEYNDGTMTDKIGTAVNQNIDDILQDVPETVREYIVTLGDSIHNDAAEIVVDKKDEYIDQINEDYSNGVISASERDQLVNIMSNLNKANVLDYLNSQLSLAVVGSSEPIELTGCSDLLGSPSTEGSPSWYIVGVFNILKYIAIIILIVLSIVDLVGATASKDEDSVKKATSKILIRLVLCIVIFLLPTLLRIVLQIISDSADMCGL